MNAKRRSLSPSPITKLNLVFASAASIISLWLSSVVYDGVAAPTEQALHLNRVRRDAPQVEALGGIPWGAGRVLAPVLPKPCDAHHVDEVLDIGCRDTQRRPRRS